jgi:hypothetical protein
MTQDEIIEMARASGFMPAHDNRVQHFAKLVAEKAHEEFGLPAVGILERTVARAVAKEREACAKIADRHSTCTNDTPNIIAIAIRARGEA